MLLFAKTSLSLCLLTETARGRFDSPAFISHSTSASITSSLLQPRGRCNRPITSLFYVQEPIPTGESAKEDSEKSVDINAKHESQDNEMWMRATRTLGSLFLHEENARDTHEGNKTSPFPFHESTLSSYLLNLKKQEEENREKSVESKQTIKKETEISVRPISSGFRIDQVHRL